MKRNTQKILEDFKERYPELRDCLLTEAVEKITDCFLNGNKLLVCGNGGSAADALHIVGELLKGFRLPRKLKGKKQDEIHTLFPETERYFIDNLQCALPAISLVNEIAFSSAFSNDQAPDLSFAQQILGIGRNDDILLAISTSGNSKNVVYAAQIAKVQGMQVISLTGRTGGILKSHSDILINVPSDETYVIQEYHLPVYHALCAAVENELFSEES